MCVNTLQHALELSSNKYGGDIHIITSLLNEAVDLASAIKADEETFEMPFFPWDHFFAVFGSLLLPLFVPLFKNVIGETLRYRAKIKAKVD